MFLTIEEKEMMAEENYPLVFSAVKSFTFNHRECPYEEVVSIAQVGYSKSFDTFDTEGVIPFSTHAMTCIQRELILDRYTTSSMNVDLFRSVSTAKKVSTI